MVSRLAALLAAALAVAPGAASAGIPVGIHPFRVAGLSPLQRADLHGILEAGLGSASRRGIVSPRSPTLLPLTCGDAPTPTCFAAAAGDGLVLAGRGELRGGVVVVTAALWDARGARTREVRFVVDLVIQNLRPVSDSLLELEVEIDPDGFVAREDKPPSARDPHGPAVRAPPSVAAAPPPSPPREPPPPAAAPAVPKPAPAAAAAPPAPKHAPPAAVRSAPARPEPRVPIAAPAEPSPPLWKRKAGPWLTGIGAALLGGGAAVGLVNRNLARDLDARHASGTLSAADRSGYDRVKTYNVLSTALFAAGGAAATAGAWIWISAPGAPDGRVALGAGGRF